MRTVLKVLSLLFAVGVLGTLVARAGIIGCQSQPASSISNDPTAQPSSPQNPTATPPAATTAAATTNAPAMTTTAPATAAAPTDTASAPKPKFLPASKAGPVWDNPTQNAPAKKGQ